MALPKRAASARTAAEEVQDHPHQAHAQARPRREEVHEVDRPHVREAGPVEPVGEAEEPQANAGEGGDQAAPAGPAFAGVSHGGVSLEDVASSGTESTEAPTSMTGPVPTLALFFVRLLREGQYRVQGLSKG
jgi:hypothetical protein